MYERLRSHSYTGVHTTQGPGRPGNWVLYCGGPIFVGLQYGTCFTSGA